MPALIVALSARRVRRQDVLRLQCARGDEAADQRGRAGREVVGARSGRRRTRDHLGFGGGRAAAVVDPEAGGHDDQQRPDVVLLELLAEELRVLHRMPEQARHRAEVPLRRDHRHLQAIAAAVCERDLAARGRSRCRSSASGNGRKTLRTSKVSLAGSPSAIAAGTSTSRKRSAASPRITVSGYFRHPPHDILLPRRLGPVRAMRPDGADRLVRADGRAGAARTRGRSRSGRCRRRSGRGRPRPARRNRRQAARPPRRVRSSASGSAGLRPPNRSSSATSWTTSGAAS